MHEPSPIPAAKLGCRGGTHPTHPPHQARPPAPTHPPSAVNTRQAPGCVHGAVCGVGRRRLGPLLVLPSRAATAAAASATAAAAAAAAAAPASAAVRRLPRQGPPCNLCAAAARRHSVDTLMRGRVGAWGAWGA